jgi:hypothetical protein
MTDAEFAAFFAESADFFAAETRKQIDSFIWTDSQ